MDLILNAAIVVITAVLIAGIVYKNRTWRFDSLRAAFCYFTVQSNVFCAFAALLMCFAPASSLVGILKYMGTAAVTVTMLTVFLFLGPKAGTLRELLKGSNLFMHLITPLLALISFCFFERRSMRFSTSLYGMIPVILYGLWYLYKIQYAPEGKRWEDFYGFRKNGRWQGMFAIMMAGTFAVCMILMLIQKI